MELSSPDCWTAPISNVDRYLPKFEDRTLEGLEAYRRSTWDYVESCSTPTEIVFRQNQRPELQNKPKFEQPKVQGQSRTSIFAKPKTVAHKFQQLIGNGAGSVPKGYLTLRGKYPDPTKDSQIPNTSKVYIEEGAVLPSNPGNVHRIKKRETYSDHQTRNNREVTLG